MKISGKKFSLNGMVLALVVSMTLPAVAQDRGSRGDRGGDRGARGERGESGQDAIRRERDAERRGGGGGGDRGGDRGGARPPRDERPSQPPAGRPGRDERPSQPPQRPGDRPGRDERPSQPPQRPGDRPGRDERPSQPPQRPGDRPGRDERPSQPPQRPGDRPGRDERPGQPPQRPGDRPGRDERPGQPRPPQGGHDRRDRREGRGQDQDSIHRRGEIDRRRDSVRRHREGTRIDWNRRVERIRHDRIEWRNRRAFESRRDYSHIRDRARWAPRYDRWYDWCPRPAVIVVTRPIRWYEPMPQYPTSWSYAQIEVAAGNLENLTREVYEIMEQVTPSNPNREYANRLMRVLGDLYDSAELYNDTVLNSYDVSDSLNELFWLEEQVALTERTLNGYSKAYLVDQEMRSLRYYVDELLWAYRQQY